MLQDTLATQDQIHLYNGFKRDSQLMSAPTPISLYILLPRSFGLGHSWIDNLSIMKNIWNLLIEQKVRPDCLLEVGTQYHIWILLRMSLNYGCFDFGIDYTLIIRVSSIIWIFFPKQLEWISGRLWPGKVSNLEHDFIRP